MVAANCLFCHFEAKYIIAENKHAFGTYFPRAIKRGHLVVAVKEHKPTFTDISDEEARSLMGLALRIAAPAKDLIGAEKYYIAAIGDLDHHFHLHLLPKLATDSPMGKHIMLDSGWKGEVGEPVSDEEVIRFIDVLRAKLK